MKGYGVWWTGFSLRVKAKSGSLFPTCNFRANIGRALSGHHHRRSMNDKESSQRGSVSHIRGFCLVFSGLFFFLL